MDHMWCLFGGQPKATLLISGGMNEARWAAACGLIRAHRSCPSNWPDVLRFGAIQCECTHTQPAQVPCTAIKQYTNP